MIQIRVLSILLVQSQSYKPRGHLGIVNYLLIVWPYHFAGEGVIVKPHNRRDHHERTAQQV